MLVLHPDSRCDVCLCEFVADLSSKSPHAIACGHIFCRDCLYANTPPLCPLCRKTYLPNKMKKLHVDKPEEVDDRKDVDLLQRLMLSWDTPYEQLQQVVNEVDTWLSSRDSDSCISLRKARTTLDRHQTLKASEADLRERMLVHEDEKCQLEYEKHSAKEQADMQIQIHEETHRTQLRQLTEELAYWKLQYKNARPGYGSYGNTRNPLPAPPEPISTEHVPTFEQAMSQTGGSARFSELPAESPRNRYDESRSRRHKRPSGHRDQGYSSYTSHTPSSSTGDRDQRYSSYTSHTPSSSSSSHYVPPHVSSSYERQSFVPESHRPLQVQFHPGRPLDVFGLATELVHEYGAGYMQGQQSAYRSRLENTVPQITYYAENSSTRAATQPTSPYITPEEDGDNNHNVYSTQPYSAPPSTLQRQPRRQSTLQPTIASSSPSLQYEQRSEISQPSRPRSESRSRPRTPASSSSDRASRREEITNPLVVSVLPEAATPRSDRARLPTARPASPSQSVRSRNTVDSWGTVRTGLSLGASDLGLRIYAFSFPDGEGAQSHSDVSSPRTRHSSISEFSNLDVHESAVEASPPRPVLSMTGVLPDEDPDRTASALSLSDAETIRRSTSRSDIRRHHAPPALDVRHPTQEYPDAYRSEHSSTARLADRNDGGRSHVPRTATATAYRSPTAVDPLSFRSDYGEAPRPALPQRDSERSSYSRLRRSEQPLRARDTLPVESPGFPVTVEYTSEEDANYYRREEARSVPTTETTSFTGNALGLELSSSGVSAPTPTTSNVSTFLRSWSHEN